MTEPREEPALLAGPSYAPQMGKWVPCSGGSLVYLSPAAGLWWSRSHEQGGGVSWQGGLVIPRKLEVCGVPRWRREGLVVLGTSAPVAKTGCRLIKVVWLVGQHDEPFSQ